MSSLFDSPLLAAAARLDQPAVLGLREAWTWRQIHEAAAGLARRLGDASAVCNLCTSRVGFLVTWLAALRGQRLLILPPSSGHADLTALLQASSRPLIVTDDAQALPEAWRQQAVCLTFRPTWKPACASAADLAWHPAWDETAVLLYTSGSTGTPEAQPKTLRQLATGAEVLGARLAQELDGGLDAIGRIVCSVPPQHMFGVECSVMLSLVHAMPVFDGRPLLPADVRSAFGTGAPGAWIATPLHLRSLVQAGEQVPHCNLVIASTMPLTQALAQQAEPLVAAPLLEIYGSTETGVLALRRPARDVRWRPAPGVRLEPADHGTRAFGSHFPSPSQLPDRIELDADGSFRLLGRQSDLIKIAGRRASLAGLNQLLQDLPELADGVFYLPERGNPTERLCLIHAGPLDTAAARRWLRARVDPVFLPRTWIRVERLPRGDNGKLPRQALDQVFEQWQRAGTAPPGEAREFTVPPEHPALAGHFPGRPIVPGVLLLDHVLTALRTARGCAPARLQHVKFAAALLPAETARIAFEDRGARVTFAVTTRRDGVSVLLASGTACFPEPAAAPP